MKAPAATFDARWNIWSASYAGRETRDGDLAVIGSHDLSARIWGFAAGADYRLDNTVFGLAVTAGETSYSLASALGSGRSEFAKLGLYGSHGLGPAYVSAALAYAWHNASTTRTVTVAGSDTLRGEFTAHNLGVRLEGGYRYDASWLSVTPYAALVVQSFRLPGYAESATSGAATFALAHSGKSFTSTRSELGAWLDHAKPLDHGTLRLRVRAAWVHDYSKEPSVLATFTGLPGSAAFNVTGAAPARNAVLLSAASEYALANGVSLIAKFDSELARSAQVYSGTATFRRVW
jgi:outer membrane autotransporter protein